MAVPLRTDPESLARMRRNVASIDDPVAFATRYLRLRGFHHQARDFDDLLAVAVDSIVKAGLTWDARPDGTGVAFTTWAYRYMDREVLRELRRDRRRAADLGSDDCATHQLADRWHYRSATDDYRRVEDRHLVDQLFHLADLSAQHRGVVEFASIHGHADGPPPAGQRPIGNLAQDPSYQTALHHLRVAARRWVERDDEWTRARARRARGRAAVVFAPVNP